MLRVNQYLRAVQGLKPGEGLVTVKDAKAVELEPEVYDQKDLNPFFKACSPFEMQRRLPLLVSFVSDYTSQDEFQCSQLLRE